MSLEQELFILSEEALTKVVDQIRDGQWELDVPKEINADGATLKTIINYHLYDTAWVPDTLAGKTIAEVGDKYDGDLLGNDPKASWHETSEKAIAAVKEFKDLDKTVHLTYGDFPARDYLWHITTFRAFRAVDLARFLNFDDKLPAKLVEGLWEILQPEADGLRQMGVFGPEVKVSEDAPLVSRLLGLSGRQP
jgi:uncharacterized protein (TIGR03086 family)